MLHANFFYCHKYILEISVAMSVLGIDSSTEFINIGQVGVLEFKSVSGISLPEIVKSRIANLNSWTASALKEVFTSIYNVSIFQCAYVDAPWMISKTIGLSGPHAFPPAQIFYLKIELGSGDSIYGLFRYIGHPIEINTYCDFFHKDWSEISNMFYDENGWAPSSFHEVSHYIPYTEREAIHRFIKDTHETSERLHKFGYL